MKHLFISALLLACATLLSSCEVLDDGGGLRPSRGLAVEYSVGFIKKKMAPVECTFPPALYFEVSDLGNNRYRVHSYIEFDGVAAMMRRDWKVYVTFDTVRDVVNMRGGFIKGTIRNKP